MKKKVRDTGIYRDTFSPPIPVDDYRQIERVSQEQDKRIFDFDSLLTKAELYAQAIIDRYKGPPPNEERPRAPSKADGIPHNVERQFNYAQEVLSSALGVRKALDQGDTKEAARNGYWVGRYYEALRVCRVEHNARHGRQQGKNAKIGTKNWIRIRKKHHVAWQAAADKIWRETPTLPTRSVATLIARRTGEKRDTIRRVIRRTTRKVGKSPASA